MNSDKAPLSTPSLGIGDDSSFVAGDECFVVADDAATDEDDDDEDDKLKTTKTTYTNTNVIDSSTNPNYSNATPTKRAGALADRHMAPKRSSSP